MAENDLTAAVIHLIETGEADHLGRVLAEGFARAAASPSRDQLAAMAMQGWLGSFGYDGCSDPHPAGLAKFAYQIADAMLAERSRA